jgi:hypothetical protein
VVKKHQGKMKVERRITNYKLQITNWGRGLELGD